MRILDEQIGDIYADILDTELELISGLVNLLQNSQIELEEGFHFFALLDCLLSMALAARQYKLTRPVLLKDSILDIRQARHLLLEQVTDVLVPNNVSCGANLSNSTPSIMILTGANYSGKSVYLKTIALCVYLAQIGCFIPADPGSRLGIVDRLFTRMQTSNYNDINSGTFFSDVKQVTSALRLASSRSLLLMDEFGKGTDMHVGIALFAGLVATLSQLDSKCPRSFFVTHFTEVIAYDLLLDYSLHISWKMMQIIHNTKGERKTKPEYESSPQEVIFLYKLVDGQSTASWGINCAKISGLSSTIIHRAVNISQKYSSLLPIDSFLLNNDLERVSNFAENRRLLNLFIGFNESTAGLEELRREFIYNNKVVHA